MSGFLANLAGLALGVPQPGAARLAQPPRLGGGIATDIGLEAEPIAQAIMTSAIAMPAPAAAPTGQPAMSLAQSHGLVEPPHRMPFRNDEGVVRGSAASRDQAAPADVAERSTAERAHTPAVQVSREPAKPFERGAASAAPRTVAPPTTSRMRPALTAPISPATLASRVTAERELRPVVTITIDRIEVRAPREALPQPTTRRPKPAPSQSLADYLDARP